MAEFAPGWSNARMTKAQVRKYVKDMQQAALIAKQKLEEARNSPEYLKEKEELKEIEKELDNL